LVVVFALPAAAINFSRSLMDDGPTEVKFAIFVHEIDEVSSASQSFDANVYLELHWTYPRLAHNKQGEVTYILIDFDDEKKP